MSKNRNIADLLDANGDVKLANLDNIDLTNLNASNLTSGSIPDARVPASAVSQHATSFDDNKLVNDISTLALRQASNENKVGYNTNSMFVDVFQDGSKVGTQSNAERDATNEKLRPRTTNATSSQIDFFNPIGGTNYQMRANNSVYTGLNAGYLDITSTNNQRFTDPETARTHGTRGGYPLYFDTVGTDRWLRWDFKQSITFGDKLAFGKQDTYGDVKHIRLRHSTDGSNWTNFDWSQVSLLSQHKNSSQDTNFTISTSSQGAQSDGYIQMSKIYTSSSGYGTAYIIVDGMPQITARYWEMQCLGLHGGTGNNNAGLGIFAPYYFATTINASGSSESTAITASSSVSSMGAIITYADEVGTNTLNTDIVLKLSADNGSNYSTATLTAMPDFASGIKMAKVNDLSVTAGTQLKYKIEFANQSSTKEASIRGVSLQY